MALNSQPILRKGGGKGSDPTAGRDDRRERAAWLDAWEWSGKWIKGKEKDGGKGYDPGKGKEKDGKGKDKGKGKGKEKDGKAKGKEGVAGNSPRRRMAAQGQWFQRCDGWCDRVSPPPRCVRPCNEIQDIRFPEHPGPHMCRECAGGEVTVISAPDEEDEVENHASYRRRRRERDVIPLRCPINAARTPCGPIYYASGWLK
jgi:hypothetical protein